MDAEEDEPGREGEVRGEFLGETLEPLDNELEVLKNGFRENREVPDPLFLCG